MIPPLANRRHVIEADARAKTAVEEAELSEDKEEVYLEALRDAMELVTPQGVQDVLLVQEYVGDELLRALAHHVLTCQPISTCAWMPH
jgi:hypothetical protein